MKIAIFGTVGAGKSSISQELSNRLKFEIFPEPIDENPYFEDYYKDIKSYAFRMQIFMLTARSKQLFAAKDLKNKIFDRTIIEDPIFMNVGHKMGNVDDTDYKTYCDFFQYVVSENLKYPNDRLKFDLVVYLKVSDETSIRRINERGRSAELSIDNEYWRVLNESYEEYYQEHKNDFPFLVIDANNDDLNCKVEEVLAHIEKISKEI
ncbi:deoxynucleoside kinase [Mesoplasma chauliocola]|uniref:Deoxynucleoside kinase n=1 Tax=Mesoplasma chauliocola TaxID=216427 RepID=A0A249SNV7_9MOLU|nr:deoxynucleoside kinase [Mesoplasma chauliocola]ASZ09316.1 deoxynucleoside kinase [Mesoplasma chauliocola]